MSTLDLSNQQATSVTSISTASLRECVKISVQNYLSQLEGQTISNVYDLVLSEIEEPLLQTIMQYTDQNQSQAAVLMGLSRGTLRKKLERYGMLISGATRNNER